MDTIILGSSSPRRRNILKQMKLPFISIPVDIKEHVPEEEAEKYTVKMATEKVKALLRIQPDNDVKWLLGADTVIEYNNRIIGKPASREEAKEFLYLFSGNKHKVVTGIALFNPKNRNISTEYAVTEVFFSTLNEGEIEWYLDTEEWRGAAGGYRIQERGAYFVEKINGCYSNVVGLPINTFYGILSKNDYPFKD
ncbi:MAG: septum formation protein Maf [Spirochaetes bacterium]|nr:MAG: septum formation protein Maf [Spirochaetota bacterium]